MDAQSSTPATVPVAPVVRMSWPRRILAVLFVLAIVGVVTAGGKLQAATEVKLSSNITGDLVELLIREGDRVQKGQVLGRIDARRYSAQLNQSEAARNSAAADAEVQNVRVAQLKSELGRVD